LGNQIKVDEMGWACGTWGWEKQYMLGVGEETWGRDRERQLASSKSTRTVIKWILKRNWRRGCRLDSSGSGEEGQVRIMRRISWPACKL
jgi:hypothetical protein